jgi:hypothetical protein
MLIASVVVEKSLEDDVVGGTAVVNAKQDGRKDVAATTQSESDDCRDLMIHTTPKLDGLGRAMDTLGLLGTK